MALSKHILFLTSATTPGMVLAITDYYCATGLFFTFFYFMIYSYVPCDSLKITWTLILYF